MVKASPLLITHFDSSSELFDFFFIIFIINTQQNHCIMSTPRTSKRIFRIGLMLLLLALVLLLGGCEPNQTSSDEGTQSQQILKPLSQDTQQIKCSFCDQELIILRSDSVDRMAIQKLKDFIKVLDTRTSEEVDRYIDSIRFDVSNELYLCPTCPSAAEKELRKQWKD